MTKIRDSIELDFCDVLFRPKRTTLNSRSEANIIREYKFKYYPHKLESCGIMSANMATTGTFKMNDTLQKFKAITCLHKHYSEEDFVMEEDDMKNLASTVVNHSKVLKEVPISYFGRGHNEGKKINWKDGIHAVIALVKYRFTD